MFEDVLLAQSVVSNEEAKRHVILLPNLIIDSIALIGSVVNSNAL